MQAKKLISTVVKDECGATAIEYGLIVALIGLAALGAIKALAGETTETWTHVEEEVLASQITVSPD